MESVTDTHCHLTGPPSRGNVISVVMSVDADSWEAAAKSTSSPVCCIGRHPWFVEPFLPSPHQEEWRVAIAELGYDDRVGSMVSAAISMSHPLTPKLEAAMSSSPPSKKWIVGECGLDKVVWKRKKKGNDFDQIAAFVAQIKLGRPMSIHCVKAGREVRMCLWETWKNGRVPPFVCVHGFCFREDEVREWSRFEARVNTEMSGVDFKVYYGVCRRHVKGEVLEELWGRCLIETDLSNESHQGNQLEELAKAAALCGGGIKAEARWRECLEML